MTRYLLIAALALSPLMADAQQAAPEAEAVSEALPEGFAPIPADGVDLAEFVWRKRVVVVFADSEFDPAFTEQMRYFEGFWPEMAERDVIVITDTDPAGKSAVREKLRPRGFMLVLIGKEGTVALRKPFPWDVRELSRAIDKMPQRLEELRVKRLGK